MTDNKNGRVIFIGLTEEQIIHIFSGAGKVNNFRLITEGDTGRPKGYGFAEFNDTDSADSAVRNLNGHEVMGRELRVAYSKDSSKDSDTTNQSNQQQQQPSQQQQSRPMHPNGYQPPPPGALPPLPPGVDLPAGLTCPDAISKTLSVLQPAQLLDILSQMKGLVMGDPARATELLKQAPQLAYAIFQALLLMGLVDTSVLASVVETSNQQTQSQPPQMHIPPQSQAQPQIPPPPQALQQQQQQHLPPRPPQGFQPQHPPPPPPQVYPQYPPQMQGQIHAPTPPAYSQPYQAPPPPQPPVQQPQAQDELIRQVMAMTQQQIDQLPPVERGQIMGLRAQLGVLATDILKTSGFETCTDNGTITVQKLDISFNRATRQVEFDVAGKSMEEQKVTATLSVSAYGKEVYKKDFNPCDSATKVEQLCPVPKGDFKAQGRQDIPTTYVSQIPSIAFNVPDLEGQAKLSLRAIDDQKELACIQSDVHNGKTMAVPGLSYVAAGIAGCALLLSGAAALANSGSAAGGHAPNPGFGTVISWFQSIAMNGMMSVQYPPVYQNYAKNFAFSGGLVSWTGFQSSIDSFRGATGGNLTEDNVLYLANASLVHTSEPNHETKNISKRSLDLVLAAFEPLLISRDTALSVNGMQAGNGTTKGGNGTSFDSKTTHFVHGIQGYVEQLTIPQANTFMTVLLVFATVIAVIAVAILLFKVILETWALFASFPKKLTGFRKRYWGLLGRTITNLVLLLYGVWTLYCIFQFTNGDSWAAKLLAGLTLAAFTALLGVFTFRIWQLARRFKKLEGDTAALFEDKETWRKYSLFYDNYKRGYWWIFIPAIIYMFAKGCVIAGANGHGLTQTAGQLIVESIMLILVLWCRPFVQTSGNVINIFIQVVRVLSVVCILVFVEELGISQSTKTITGVVLIAVQSVLTAVLAILIAVNAIIVCVRENPHRKQRKEAEKLLHDNLTTLSPRNTLLMNETAYKDKKLSVRAYPVSQNVSDDHVPYDHDIPKPSGLFYGRDSMAASSETLVRHATPMGIAAQRNERSVSRYSARMSRQPTVPNVGQAM
ncbi:uncharacterized protein KY384_002485 [Bacidia gigantensis]|uniref:uncharacterized protein n=1 Tax=Bacidia gigantensis TaxID=2732470 RepID=UPI001D04AEBE|nr:uncharacterized protein KY384_002485 [Bacidia gigantensis]KAG8532608.1 hypothetical protein KY384_002485 [Bacidia gigantensis]